MDLGILVLTHVEGKVVCKRTLLKNDLKGDIDREGNLKEEGVVY